MSRTVKEAAKLLEVLPEREKDFALEFIKRLVIAWDPDFTKVTPEEARKLAQAEAELARGEYEPESNQLWD